MIVPHLFQTIWCDAPDCNESFEQESSASEALAVAYRLGWRRRRRNIYFDLCPKHADA